MQLDELTDQTVAMRERTRIRMGPPMTDASTLLAEPEVRAEQQGAPGRFARGVVFLLIVSAGVSIGFPGVANASEFRSLRIGDLDSFGFTGVATLVNRNGGPADTDGDGVLEPPPFDPNMDGVHEPAECTPIEFAPDLDGNGSFSVGSDEFDNRSAVELDGGVVTGAGAVNVGSAGSEWTDFSVSTAFVGPFPDGDPTRPNNPVLMFDFEVEDADPGLPLVFRLVWADAGIAPQSLLFTFADSSTLRVDLEIIDGAELGGITWAASALPFEKVFSVVPAGLDGYVRVDVEVPDDPFFAIDYAELVSGETSECGNGALEAGEQCDDGNTAAGDGCDQICRVEAFTCCQDSTTTCNVDAACGTGSCCSGRCDSDGDAGNGCDGAGPACGSGSTTECTGGAPSCCGPVCGNGFVEPGEECDDGNVVDGDACSSTCIGEGLCTGDGLTGCVDDADCAGSGGTCCGNAILTSPEECDDGNLIWDDSCDNTCAACDDCPPACLGFQGPGAIQATVKKTLLKNKDGLNGTTEKWTTKGEFDLSSTQAASLNPATQPVQVLFRESDGVGGFSSLWTASPTLLPAECAPAPSCWVLKGKTGKLKWNYKDKDETLNPGLQKGLIKQKFNEFQFKFKGNLAEIGEPQVNRGTSENPVYRVREDVIVGGICSSVLMDCIQKNTTYKCFPAIGP